MRETLLTILSYAQWAAFIIPGLFIVCCIYAAIEIEIEDWQRKRQGRKQNKRQVGSD